MDVFASRKYESIDALIMAAEVLERVETLERAEILAKEQLSLQSNPKALNYDLKNIQMKNSVFNECKYPCLHHEHNGNDDLADNLLQTIDYIKELKTSEMWNDLLEKETYNNEILYDLRKKIYQMKGITSNVNQILPIITQDQNEDTPTASEDEGYNKYTANNVNNLDDITDDASECEEALKMPYKSKVNKSHVPPKVIKNKRIKVKHKGENITKNNYNISKSTNRKRKCSDNINLVDVSSKVRSHPLCDPSMTFMSHNANDINCLPTSLTYLHYPNDYKTILKIHQAVDI